MFTPARVGTAFALLFNHSVGCIEAGRVVTGGARHQLFPVHGLAFACMRGIQLGHLNGSAASGWEWHDEVHIVCGLVSSKQFAIDCLQQCFDAHTQTDPASSLAVSLETLGCACGRTCVVVSSGWLRTLKVEGVHCWTCLVCLLVIAIGICVLACHASSVHAANQWHATVASFCLRFWRSRPMAVSWWHQIMHTQMACVRIRHKRSSGGAPCRTQTAGFADR